MNENYFNVTQHLLVDDLDYLHSQLIELDSLRNQYREALRSLKTNPSSSSLLLQERIWFHLNPLSNHKLFIKSDSLYVQQWILKELQTLDQSIETFRSRQKEQIQKLHFLQTASESPSISSSSSSITSFFNLKPISKK